MLLSRITRTRRVASMLNRSSGDKRARRACYWPQRRTAKHLADVPSTIFSGVKTACMIDLSHIRAWILIPVCRRSDEAGGRDIAKISHYHTNNERTQGWDSTLLAGMLSGTRHVWCVPHVEPNGGRLPLCVQTVPGIPWHFNVDLSATDGKACCTLSVWRKTGKIVLLVIVFTQIRWGLVLQLGIHGVAATLL